MKHLHTASLLRPLSLGLLFLAGQAAAQGLALFTDGDTVPGVGPVNFYDQPRINRHGEWAFEAREPVSGENLVVRNGLAVLREGDVVGGSVVQGFDSLDLGDELLSIGLSLDTGDGLWFDGALVLEDAAAPNPAPGCGSPTYRSLGTAWADRKAVYKASLQCTGFSRDALLAFDPGTGSETLVAVEDELLGTTGETVDQIGKARINDAGDVIWSGDLNITGDVVVVNTTPVLLDGDIEPVTGRPLISFSKVDLNDAGDHVAFGSLAGTPSTDNRLIVKNGAKLVLENEVLTSTAPHSVVPFALGGGKELFIDNAGRVWWTGYFDFHNGLFCDLDLVLEEGVSTIEGQTVTGLYDHAVNDDGSEVLLVVELDNATDALCLLTPDGSVTAMERCTSAPGSLAVVAGTPALGDTLTFELDDAQVSGATPILLVASAPILTWPVCGLSLPGIGELLIDLDRIEDSFAVPTWNGAPVTVNVFVPNMAALYGLPFYWQGVFLGLGGISPTEPVRLTGGVRMRLGL